MKGGRAAISQEFDAHSGMEVTNRDPLMAARSVKMLGDDLALSGYFPNQTRSSAVWRLLGSDGQVKWQHVEESEHWDFPVTIIEHKNSYLTVSLSPRFDNTPNSVTLRISEFSKSGEVLKVKDFPISINAAGASDKSVLLTSHGEILIAIGGTQWVSAGTKDSVWVNPRTGSRKFCSPEDLTELISIDPDSLELLKRNIVKGINVSAMTEDRGRIYAVGASHLNCRLETDTKIAELTPSLDLSINFESRNVNSVDIFDIKALGNGVLLLGGRVDVFLPNVLANKVLSTEELNKSLVSKPWAKSFWELGKGMVPAFCWRLLTTATCLQPRFSRPTRASFRRTARKGTGTGFGRGQRIWRSRVGRMDTP